MKKEQGTKNKEQGLKTAEYRRKAKGLVLLFIPLIIAGGRLACRVVMNLWNMIES